MKGRAKGEVAIETYEIQQDNEVDAEGNKLLCEVSLGNNLCIRLNTGCYCVVNLQVNSYFIHSALFSSDAISFGLAPVASGVSVLPDQRQISAQRQFRC